MIIFCRIYIFVFFIASIYITSSMYKLYINIYFLQFYFILFLFSPSIFINLNIRKYCIRSNKRLVFHKQLRPETRREKFVFVHNLSSLMGLILGDWLDFLTMFL